MPVTIMSQAKAFALAENYKHCDIVSIMDSRWEKELPPGAVALDTYQSVLRLYFDDVEEPAPGFGMRAPTRADVQCAVDWGRGKDLDRLVVHCFQGISRSAALAVVITCSQGVPPRDSFDMLISPRLHAPNRLILSLGRQILGQDGIIDEYFARFSGRRQG
ncbi:MAG: hypothetical protein HON70_28225 [Lentisphaerae bacterium]|nr:hypothetical protein [Lentisphaerota bacterium]